MSGPYPRFEDVDPRTLRCSSGYPTGADAFKLARQIARYGSSTVGMRPPWVEEDDEGLLGVLDGMTRTTRVAKLLPGVLIRVEVTEPARQSLRGRLMIVAPYPDPEGRMNIAARTELMSVLAEISQLVPFIRLGQLLTNLAADVDAPWAGNVREVEDEELLPVAREYLARLKTRPPESFAEQIRFHEMNDPAPAVARAS